MGLFDGLIGSDDSGGGRKPSTDDRYRIVSRAPDGTAHAQPDDLDDGAWKFSGEPPTKEQFRFEFGDQLEPGITYVCVPSTRNGPDFDNVQWSFEREGTRKRDEVEEIRQIFREEASNSPAAQAESIEEALILSIQQEQGAKAALNEYKEIQQAKNGSDTDYFAEADLSDQSEVLTAAMMNLMNSYDSVGEAVEDVMGGALEGAMGPRAGPGAAIQQQPPQQQPAQQQPAQQGAEPPQQQPEPDQADEPSGTQAKSAARELAEQAEQDAADDREPEETLDLSTDPDPESREQMADEIGADLDNDQDADAGDVEDAEPVDAETDPGNMSAAPAADDQRDGPTEGEIAAESEVRASPEVVERAASDGGADVDADQADAGDGQDDVGDDEQPDDQDDSGEAEDDA